MVTATRLLLFAMTAVSIPIYLVFIVPEGLLMQAAGAVLILLLVSMIPVSYTHLTLPTKRIV